MNCRGNQPMMRTFIVRALSFSAVAALTLNPALTPVVAARYRTPAPALALDGQEDNDMAVRLAGGADKVVNSIAVRGRDQVMLKVTLAEVQRSIIKQLGIDLTASMSYGTSVVKFSNSNPFTANNAPIVPTN